MPTLFPARGVSKLTTPGHVYFIQSEGGGPIKIGWATSPETRMAHLQAHCPGRLVLLHSEPGNGREEAELHAKFKADRLHGEWFAPTAELIAEIHARRGRNAPKAYVPAVYAEPPEPRAIPAAVVARTIPAEPESLPPQPHWEPGNPGWDRLVMAVKSLG